jgi:hypothetical protein
MSEWPKGNREPPEEPTTAQLKSWFKWKNPDAGIPSARSSGRGIGDSGLDDLKDDYHEWWIEWYDANHSRDHLPMDNENFIYLAEHAPTQSARNYWRMKLYGPIQAGT